MTNLYLRYGKLPESGFSSHKALGYSEAGISIMAPLNELGKSSWSIQMIFTMTAGASLDIENLYIIEGEEIDAIGSDGETLVKNAKIIRLATELERYQLVADMVNCAINHYGFQPVSNIFELLKSEKPV